MPIPVVCPNGHRAAARDEDAGKPVRCPVCQVIVLAPLSVPPSAEVPVPPGDFLLFQCPNRHPLRVPASLAGQPVMCPTCRAVLTAPAAIRPQFVPPGPVGPAPVPAHTSTPTDDPAPEAPAAAIVAAEILGAEPGALEEQAAFRLVEIEPSAPPSEPAEDDPGIIPLQAEEIEPPRQKKKRAPDQTPREHPVVLAERLMFARLGLGFLMGFAIVQLAAKVLTLALLAGILLKASLGTLQFLGGVVQLGMIAAPTIGIVGCGFCLRAPRESKTLELVIATIVTMGISLILAVSLLVVYTARDPLRGGSLSLYWSSLLASFVAQTCFLLFLRQMAVYCEDPGSASEAWDLLIDWGRLLLVAIGVDILGAILVRLIVGFPLLGVWLVITYALIAIAVVTIMSIMWLIRLFNLLSVLRSSV